MRINNFSIANSMLVFFLILIPSVLFAKTYEISVTRKSSNVYSVDGGKIMIHTKHCYAYVYSENAYLRAEPYNEKLIFIDSNDSCDVSGVYSKNELNNGSYEVKVSHEDDDWYSIWGTDSFIQTSMCLQLALVDDAILKIQGYSSKLFFDNNNQCQVENIYSKIKL